MNNYPSWFDTARAIRDAQGGSTVAKVALMVAVGDEGAYTWPTPFRETAVNLYTIVDD